MKKIFSMGIALSLLILSMSSCKKNNTMTLSGTSQNDINIATDATLGQYLTNKQGLTLYMFANDADSTSSCIGGCESTWPPFTADLSTAKLAAGLSASDFATITTASGKNQVTYKGWPLYTFSPSGMADVAGSTKGDGIGGLWFIAKPDYTIMLANKQLTGLDGNNYKSDYTMGTGNTVYFTDGAGKTLYTFSLDSFNINKFTKADFSNNSVFPIYQQTQIVVPSILNKTLFGTITVFGKTQMTYNGWPLYFFGKDTERGSNKGVSVPVPGIWPVAVQGISVAKK